MRSCTRCGELRLIRPGRRVCTPCTRAVVRVNAKKRLFDALGGKCACCGETEWAFLVIDHVNDDGYLERDINDATRRRKVNSVQRYTNAMKELDRFQLLCCNCNYAKSFNPGGCPHKIVTA